MFQHILLLAQVLIVALGSNSTDELFVYRSPTINNVAEHTTCKVHQGDMITLLACDNAYELYETNALALEPYGLTNYGEKRPATGINKSQVKGKESHITYLLEGKTVKTAYWD